MASQVEALVNDPDNRTTAFLLKNGVPFDVAESWSDDERMAFCIIFGELEGGEWDWDKMRWMKKG